MCTRATCASSPRQSRVSLERDGLPGNKEIASAAVGQGAGLTSPELALLLAHTKIAAGQQVLASDLPDDPALRFELADYFPAPLRERFADQLAGGQLARHRLRREIITTSVINEMVDTGGSTFLFRLGEETGLPVPDITRSWLVASEVFGMRAFWQRVQRLDGVVDVDARIARPRGPQARGTRDQVAAGEPAASVRHRRDGGLLRRRSRRGPLRHPRSCSPGATWSATRSGAPPSPGAGCRRTSPPRSRRWSRRTRRSTS